MKSRKATGVLLSTGVLMSSLSYADEESIRAHLANAEATKYLAGCRGYKSAPKAWKDRMPKVPKGTTAKKAPAKKAAPKAKAKAASKKAPKKKR